MTETPSSPTHISASEWLSRISAVVQPEAEPILRRSHRRYAVEGEVKASGTFEDGTPFKRTWTLLQVSAQGLTIKSEQPIERGMILEFAVNIDGNPMPMRGEIMHCTQTLGGYKLGVHILFAEPASDEKPA